MSELDETFARWRRETEKVQPSAELMAKLNALAVAPPTKATGGGAVMTKLGLVVIVLALLAVAGWLFLVSRGVAPATEASPAAPAQPAAVLAAPKVDAEPMAELPAATPGVPVVRLPSSPAAPQQAPAPVRRRSEQ